MANGRGRAGFVIVSIALFFGLCYLALGLAPFPALGAFLARSTSIVVTDRHDKLLQILPVDGGIRRPYVKLDAIPPFVQAVFIQSEDARFYVHPGFDILAIARGFWIDMTKHGIVSGASTITMQLSRLVSPHREGAGGKLLEVFNALRLESRMSKRQILESWLNAVPFSHQVEGVEGASRLFFGKPVSELTRGEAVILAVVPRNPSRYDPIAHRADALAAALLLASRCVPAISPEEVQAAASEASLHLWPFEAPHFVRWVAGTLTAAEPARGETLRTSLDLGLSDFMSERIRFYLDQNRNSRLTNGAGILIDNHTGEILAYVGSGNFFSSDTNGQIDGVQIVNQSGSTLKPFLYALALDRGFLPTTLLPDIPQDFGGAEAYVPMNFDKRFHGPVRLRVALASSLNVPAVYTVERLGVDAFAQFLRIVGFGAISAREAGPGIAVGNAKVSLFDLVQAFALFPRGGRTTKAGFRYGGNDEGDQVVSRYTAGEISSILSDNDSRVSAFGLDSPLHTSFPAMFKTGTSTQFQNLWCVGATPDYTVGIWMGNFNGETVTGKRSSSIPALVAAEMLGKVQSRPAQFPPPSDSEEVRICTLSGERAGPDCPSTTTEYLPKGTELPVCTLHGDVGGKPALMYPDLYSFWLSQTGRSGLGESAPPASGAGENGLRIVSPNDGALFYYDPSVADSDQAVAIQAAGGADRELSVYVNGAYEGTIGIPYRYLLPLKPGRWRVELRGSTDRAEVGFDVR